MAFLIPGNLRIGGYLIHRRPISNTRKFRWWRLFLFHKKALNSSFAVHSFSFSPKKKFFEKLLFTAKSDAFYFPVFFGLEINYE